MREALIIVNLESKAMRVELEEIREDLYGIVDKNGLASPEAICASRVMDNKLNEYYRLQN